jgi:hypothetical protein
MLNLEYEVNKLISYVGDEDRKTCCGRNRVFMRFNRVIKALAQAKASDEYDKEQLNKIESLVDELAKEYEIDLSGIKRRYKC